ncbi:MAG: YeeE/YedE family protein [Gemmatimonadetes bacterium]|nr:YeeE/YedE family protein [Gemmatimonadota bacterium]
MIEWISQPWPWYVAGPVIGLMVPLLLLAGGKLFGLSSNFRHVCAAVWPGRNEFLRYDWKRTGMWNLTFAAGIMIGAWIAWNVLPGTGNVGISEATQADLRALGIEQFEGLLPGDVFSWSGLGSVRSLITIVLGGFLVGFGTRYAGGCTSGHAITGLSDLQFPSLIAVIAFFAGGLLMTHVLLPFIL